MLLGHMCVPTCHLKIPLTFTRSSFSSVLGIWWHFCLWMAFVHPSHLILCVDVCAYFGVMFCHFVCVLVWKPLALCTFLFICVYAFFNYLLAQFWRVHVPWFLHYAPSSFCLFNVKWRWWFASFTWLFFSLLPPSFHSNTLTNSIHSLEPCVDVFGAGKNCFLTLSLRRVLLWQIWQPDWTAEGFAGYLPVIWLGDWLTCGWLNDWLVFRQGDTLTG